jgi:hypothetical protein
MNRRGFLSLLGLAPVAGVMAARDAMAAPAVSRAGLYEFSALLTSESFFIGERAGESTFITPNQARKILGSPDEIFGVDGGATRAETTLAFVKRDEPGVAI